MPTDQVCHANRFPNVTQWITEYALDNSDLKATQQFFNMSMEYFDRLESVGRYSYFGAFRSQVSNVGPNVPFLNNDGVLTDIGSWYLGGSATGVNPQSGTKTNEGGRLQPWMMVLLTFLAVVCTVDLV